MEVSEARAWNPLKVCSLIHVAVDGCQLGSLLRLLFIAPMCGFLVWPRIPHNMVTRLKRQASCKERWGLQCTLGTVLRHHTASPPTGAKALQVQVEVT